MQPSGIVATGGMWSALDPATGKIGNDMFYAFAPSPDAAKH
jgi:hypothetical protein